MRGRGRLPLFLPPGGPIAFPDPRAFDGEGLIAVGGDLSPERLLAAYRSGIFPWFSEGLEILWWSPDPRAVLTADSLHCSGSLRRSWRRQSFITTWNRRFGEVITACGEDRPEGTWILTEMVDGYVRLHRLGHAQSIEVWCGEELVGGLYGVRIGGLFAAESMFHRAADASKVALVQAVNDLWADGVTLFDVQFLTPHLQSMGAFEIPRPDYLERLAAAVTGGS